MRRSLRLATVALVAAAAVAAGAASLGLFEHRAESAPSPGLDALFPAYPGSRLYPMGDSLSMNGVSLRVGYFVTQAKPSEVAGYYAKLWGDRGLPITLADGDDHAEAAAYDTAAGAMRSVTVVRRGERMVGFASIVPMDGQEKPEAAAGDLPLPTGAMLVQHTRSAEGGRDNQSLAFVMQCGLSDEQAALKKAFTAKGWKVVRELPQPALHGASLRFARGEQLALATLAGDSETATVGVQVQETSADDEEPKP